MPATYDELDDPIPVLGGRYKNRFSDGKLTPPSGDVGMELKDHSSLAPKAQSLSHRTMRSPAQHAAPGYSRAV